MTGSMQYERGNFTAVVIATKCRSFTNSPDRLFQITLVDRLGKGVGEGSSYRGARHLG